jgi:hypothetical protein
MIGEPELESAQSTNIEEDRVLHGQVVVHS